VSRPQTAVPGWLVAIVGLGIALTALGAVVAIADPALLLGPGEQVTGATRVYAGYLFSRNLALAAALTAALAIGARRQVVGLVTLAGLIQALDVAVDAATGRWVLVPGLTVLTALFFVAARRLAGQPLWRPGTWRD
jgi:hypothetical protein